MVLLPIASRCSLSPFSDGEREPAAAEPRPSPGGSEEPSTAASDGLTLTVSCKNTFLNFGCDEQEERAEWDAHQRGARTCTARFSEAKASFLHEDDEAASGGEQSSGVSDDVDPACFESTPLWGPTPRCGLTPRWAPSPRWAETPHWAPTPRWSAAAPARLPVPPQQEPSVPPDLPAKAKSAPEIVGTREEETSEQVMLPIPWDAVCGLHGLPMGLEPDSFRVMSTCVQQEDGRVVVDLKVAIRPCQSLPVDSQGLSAAEASAAAAALNPALLQRAGSGAGRMGTHGGRRGAGAAVAMGLPHAPGLAQPCVPQAALAGTLGPPPGFNGVIQKNPQVCCHWKNKGWCRYQASCKFMHPEHKRGVGALPDTSSRNRRRQVSKQAAAGPAPLAGQAVRMLLRAPEQRRAAGDVAVTLWPPTVAHGQPMDGRCAATM